MTPTSLIETPVNVRVQVIFPPRVTGRMALYAILAWLTGRNLYLVKGKWPCYLLGIDCEERKEDKPNA